MKTKKPASVYIIALLCISLYQTTQAAGGETLGIGIITNTTTRASESFKLFQILSSLELKDAGNKRLNIVFADNPSVSTYFITGEISHFTRVYDQEHSPPYGIITIDNYKHEHRHNGYMTIFRLQLWEHGKFRKSFTDSALYIPSNEEIENEPMPYGRFETFYDEGYKLYSPLLFGLFKMFQATWNIYAEGLRKSDILKFDVKGRGEGSTFHMDDFLPARHALNDKVPGSPGSFNSYFENTYATVERKELFFLANYGSGNLNSTVALVSYPKTTWKAATESYLGLAAKDASSDIETANMASWSALILSSQIKDKVSTIYKLKAQALNNILSYSKKKNYTMYSRLLELDLALTDGFLRSRTCRNSDAHFDSLFSELSITFSNTQATMNSLRAQNRFNSIINGLNFGATMLSAANDGAQGYNTSSEATNRMMNTYLETSRSSEAQMQEAIGNFRERMNGLDLSLPMSVIQANGEDNINTLKSFLYLECMKLIYVDKNNEYWSKTYENFCSSSPDLLRDFLGIRDKSHLSVADLKTLSGGLLNYEKYAFMNDKLRAQ